MCNHNLYGHYLKMDFKLTAPHFEKWLNKMVGVDYIEKQRYEVSGDYDECLPRTFTALNDSI